MTLQNFIKENRQTIRDAIAAHSGEDCRPTNDSETEDWILNDEGLYNWARSEGVPI